MFHCFLHQTSCTCSWPPFPGAEIGRWPRSVNFSAWAVIQKPETMPESQTLFPSLLWMLLTGLHRAWTWTFLSHLDGRAMQITSDCSLVWVKPCRLRCSTITCPDTFTRWQIVSEPNCRVPSKITTKDTCDGVSARPYSFTLVFSDLSFDFSNSNWECIDSFPHIAFSFIPLESNCHWLPPGSLTDSCLGEPWLKLDCRAQPEWTDQIKHLW